MCPTLPLDMSYAITDVFSFKNGKDPSIGDVLVFYSPTSGDPVLKRILALVCLYFNFS